MNWKELRHDRHTVSLLTDHLVFSPKYRGKIEMDIQVIEIAVNPDHVHIFFKYPPKYSLSYIAKRIKGSSSRILRKEFPHLREWCGETSCFHGSVGNGWEVVEKYIREQDNYEYKRGKY